MALNIEDQEIEQLAAEVAEMSGDTETGAVREALREKRERLEAITGRGRPVRERNPASMQEWLEQEIWPRIPASLLDREPMSKQEKEDLLGYGPEGR